MRSSTNTSRSRRTPARALAAHLAFLLAAISLAVVAAHGQNATWTGSADNDWNNSANWSPTAVPIGTATFAQAPITSIVFSPSPPVVVGTLAFDANAFAYDFTLCACNVLRITGAGILNSSAFAPVFHNDGGRIVFRNASVAGNADITNRFGGQTLFRETTSAANATITNRNGGQTRFRDASTAGHATITNNNGLTVFRDQATAANATITNRNGGETRFRDSSTAANADITNNGGATIFRNQSTAANATITTRNSGATEFHNHATAGNATIVTRDGSFLGFFGHSDAGSANITTRNGSLTVFDGSSSAANAIITTLSGSQTVFAGQSTGGNAQFITAAGGLTDFSFTSGPPSGAGQITAGSIAGAGTYFIGGSNNGLTVGGNNLSTEVSGVIADGCGCFPGSLVKTGTGTLTLSGFNLYTGATTVDAGKLIVNGSIASSSNLTVNSGATVGGNGLLPGTLINGGGTLSPGTSIGTLNLASLAFASGSKYLVEVSGTQNDFSNVAGAATLAGGTVQVAQTGPLLFAHDYKILTAGTPLTDRFAGANGNLLTVTLRYDTNNVFLSLLPNFSGVTGLNTNQNAVANALDRGFTLAGSSTGFEALFQLPPASLPYLLSQLSGEIRSAVAPAGFEVMGQFLALMLDPFAGTRGEAGNSQGPALGFAPEQRVAREAESAFAAYRMITKAPAALAEPRWTVWAAGYGSTSNARGDAVVGSHDRHANTGNLAAGADYRLSPDTVVGFAVAGGATNFSLNAGFGSGRGDILQGGVYGATRFDSYYLAASLAAAYYDVSTDRIVSLAGAVSRLTSSFAASGFGARLEGGRRFVVAGSGLTPFAAIQAQTIHLPAVNEVTLAGPANVALAYAEQNASRLRSEFGVKVDREVGEWLGGSLFLFARAAWAHQFWRDNPAIATLPILPGSGFTVQGAFSATDSALLSSGAELKFADGLSLRGKLEAELAPAATALQASVTLRKVW